MKMAKAHDDIIPVGGFSGPLSIYLTESHTWLYEPTESPWPFVIILAGSIGCLSLDSSSQMANAATKTRHRGRRVRPARFGTQGICARPLL